MTKEFIFKSHHGSKFRPEFQYENDNHTPYNKRHGEVKSIGRMFVQDYDGRSSNPDAWTEIRLSEITTSDSGRVAERNISITLEPARMSNGQPFILYRTVDVFRDGVQIGKIQNVKAHDCPDDRRRFAWGKPGQHLGKFDSEQAAIDAVVAADANH